jgi:hypothetical protein
MPTVGHLRDNRFAVQNLPDLLEKDRCGEGLLQEAYNMGLMEQAPIRRFRTHGNNRDRVLLEKPFKGVDKVPGIGVRQVHVEEDQVRLAFIE